MATEKVKVYEEKAAKKGAPIWAWLLPLLLLVLLAIWWFNRSSHPADNGAAATTAATDQTKPDASPGTQALTAASIGQTLQQNGRITLDDSQVHFATGSATLAGDSQAVLDQVAQTLKDNSGWKMGVIGYTDSTGNRAANEKLAGQRAQSVMAYLSSHGVDANRLQVQAEGQRQPVASNASDNGRAENRRVELVKE